MDEDRLNRSELRWLERNKALEPEVFVRGFFRYRARSRRETQPRRLWRSKLLLLLTNINSGIRVETRTGELVDVPPYFGAELESRLRDAEQADFSEFCLCARDLVRGYTDAQVDAEAEIIRVDKSRLLQRARELLVASSRAERRALKRKKDASSAALTENRKQLDEIVESLKSIEPRTLATTRLINRDRQRMFPFLSSILHSRDPIEWAAQGLSLATPAQFEMPLRFIQDIGYREWLKLVSGAAGGASRNQLLDLLESLDGLVKVPKQLEQTARELGSLGLPDNSKAIRELVAAWQSGSFLSCTLIAVVIAEGSLWHLADLLNRKGIRIYQRKRNKKRLLARYPYIWDRAQRAYARVGRKFKVGKGELTSGKELLKQTRLGSLVSGELYSFLVEEHPDFRNPLLHGHVEEEVSRYDATLALLCCASTLREVALLATSDRAGLRRTPV
jgi:hypothetical protein